MANQLQQRTLASTVSKYAQQHGLLPHRAFLFLVIERYLSDLEMNSVEIEESIVDGSEDCGIDAIVIDDDEARRPVIYFFQSKYYDSDNAFERKFEGNALEKIEGALREFVLNGRINSAYQNARLVDRLHSVRNLGSRNPKYIIVLCSNSDEPAEPSKTRLQEFVDEINASAAGDYMAVEYLHLERITRDFIAPQQRSRVNTNIQITGRYLTEDTGNTRLFIGAVEATELVRLVRTYGDDLFERNVRGYLRQINVVNKGIKATASGGESPYFVYMNNGLTLTCEKFTHTPISSSPNLQLTNAQIVNGQQTARSLFQASNESTLKDDVKVLVRIVETVDQNILDRIVEATNSQTKVTSRDLHSNDEIQKLIEQQLATQGYFYEARKNKYQGKDTSKRVDAEIAAQAYYAIYFEEPAFAKDKKKLLFGDKYDDIFNEDLNPQKILYSFKLLQAVRLYNGETRYNEAYTFLKDASLHIASLIHRLAVEKGAENIDLSSKRVLRTSYVRVVKALAELVKERIEIEGDKYEHRRTFKDPETYGRSLEILLEQ